MIGKMQELTAKEIAQATVLFSIKTLPDSSDNRIIYFTYYGRYQNKTGELNGNGKDSCKVGKLFQHSMPLEKFNNLVEEKGLEIVLKELENYRQKPLETIYKIIGRENEESE